MSNLPSLFNSTAFTDRPMRDLFRMQRQMDRLFDELSGQAEKIALSPNCDVEETENHYLLSFDLPGVKKSDIRVDLQGDVLTVSGERKDERTEEKSKKNYSERYWGAFQRSFQVPAGLKPEQVEAHYSDGVLRVAFPKSETARTGQIPISEGKATFWDKVLGHKKPELRASSDPNAPVEQRASVKVV